VSGSISKLKIGARGAIASWDQRRLKERLLGARSFRLFFPLDHM
jgi:hypothetical protein